jgi:hypothetical protein
MGLFQASTKLQCVLIVQLGNSRMILIRQVVPIVQLDIMRKIFLKLIMSKENVTMVALNVLVASMERVKNRLMKQQVVMIVLSVDFQI